MSFPIELIPEHVVVQLALTCFALTVVLMGLLVNVTKEIESTERRLVIQYSIPGLKLAFFLSGVALFFSFVLVNFEQAYAKELSMFCLYLFFPFIAMNIWSIFTELSRQIG